jgi:hypothetical protein
MRYDLLFAPEAVEDYENLAANVRAEVRDGIERHLRHDRQRLVRAGSSDCVGCPDRSIAYVLGTISAYSTT